MQTTLTRRANCPVRTRSIWQRMVAAIVDADARHRDRQAFRNLPDHLRRDIGQLPTSQWSPPEIMRNSGLW